MCVQLVAVRNQQTSQIITFGGTTLLSRLEFLLLHALVRLRCCISRLEDHRTRISSGENDRNWPQFFRESTNFNALELGFTGIWWWINGIYLVFNGLTFNHCPSNPSAKIGRRGHNYGSTMPGGQVWTIGTAAGVKKPHWIGEFYGLWYITRNAAFIWPWCFCDQRGVMDDVWCGRANRILVDVISKAKNPWFWCIKSKSSVSPRRNYHFWCFSELPN